MEIITNTKNKALNSGRYYNLYYSTVNMIEKRNEERNPPFRYFLPLIGIEHEKENKENDFKSSFKHILHKVSEINADFVSSYNSVIINDIKSETYAYLNNVGLEKFADEAHKLKNITTLKKNPSQTSGFQHFLIELKDGIQNH